MEQRATRELDGHTYEFTQTYVDDGSVPYVNYIPSYWDIARDGEPAMSLEEAERWRLLAFGEWRWPFPILVKASTCGYVQPEPEPVTLRAKWVGVSLSSPTVRPDTPRSKRAPHIIGDPQG